MGAGIAASPHCAERRICRSIAKPIPKDHLTKVRAHQLRRRLPSSKHPQGISSMFRGPSWVDHSWRPALLFPLPKKRSKPRRARGKINSSGASSRLAPKHSEEHLIACRRRSVLPSTSAPSCRCRPSGEAGTSVPITQEQCTCRVSRKSEKYESYPVDNGDIGNNRRNISRLAEPRPESRPRIALELRHLA
jgi:hypothetical protein